ncbi:hypothetical protein [Nostoc sp. UHCC 0252]|nr:hypothetical protein [Nostoc sp. UHCC 0252]MEA5600541.1 hypothetical protein [Nostoc sp. UHCC 0252]
MISYFAYRVGDGLRPTVGDIDVSFNFGVAIAHRAVLIRSLQD